MGLLLILAVGYNIHLEGRLGTLEASLRQGDAALDETAGLAQDRGEELAQAQEEVRRLTRQKAELIKEVKFFDYTHRTVDLYDVKTFLLLDDPEIVALADAKDAKGLYEFVRDGIAYNSRAESNHNAGDILEEGKGNCVEKAVLLASLLRADGHPPEEVQVVLGTINYVGYEWEPPENHAWVEFFYEGRWMVLDPSDYLGTFEFGQWEKEDFYRTYDVDDYFRYNDQECHLVKKYDSMPDPSSYN